MIRGKGFGRALLIGISLFICMVGGLANPSDSPAAGPVLHSFSGGVNDGGYPSGDLTLSGTTFYGMTTFGGANTTSCGGGSCGAIFQIDMDGTGFQVLHSFSGGASDGANPQGALTLSGTTLYGMTPAGGAGSLGTIFKINTDGTGYQVLYSFGATGTGGGSPSGSLTVSGSTLYGMTSGTLTGPGVPTKGYGAVFQINTDGTGFQNLHTFTGDANGGNPDGSLTLSGSTLYGMTSGGATSYGTIFKINTDGAGFQSLYGFGAASGANGAYPNGALTISGSTLYGMTTGGGSGEGGVIFKINTDGTGFSVLYNFQGYPSNATGNNPFGSLILSGYTLYGMTVAGGAGGQGAIFQINTDGSGYEVLYSFTGGTSDGSYPLGSLTLSGSTLYGMTQAGGTSHDGTIFSVTGVVAPVRNSLLWKGTDGSAGLWTLDGSNNWTAGVTYGPYSDWTPVNYSYNSDGTRTLLWAGTDGSAAIWTLDSSNDLTASISYGPYSGWTPVNYTCNSDGTRTLLWAGTGGTAGIWTLDSSNNPTASISYGPYGGWTPLNYTYNSDGTRTLLWVGTGGTAGIWTLDSSNNWTAGVTYGPYSGWTPVNYGCNSDGTRTLLWAGTGGNAGIWTLDSSNNWTAGTDYGPYSGWTPLNYSYNLDGTGTMLWVGTGGPAGIWTFDSSNNPTASVTYGPYSGWTPIQYR